MLDTLAAPIVLRSLPVETGLLIGALRHWVRARRAERCPTAAAAAHLGSARAAAHLGLLVEEIAACWPDPFAVAPPCCPRLSHDEATLAAMLRLGAGQDRRGFDDLLRDLLPADARERLFVSSTAISRVLAV